MFTKLKPFFLLSLFVLFLQPFSVFSQAIPTGKDTSTEKEFKDLMANWWEMQISGNFQKRNENKLDELQGQMDFLDEFCLFVAESEEAKPAKELYEMGKDYIKLKKEHNGEVKIDFDGTSGQLDAVFAACLGDIIVQQLEDNNKSKEENKEEYKKAKALLEFAHNYLNNQGYSIPFQALIADDLARATYRINKRNWKQEYQSALSLIPQSLAKDYYTEPGELRIAYFLLLKRYWMKWTVILEKVAKQLKEHEEEYSPWLINILKGHLLDKKGWRARGSGYAGSVTKEGWQKFKKSEEAAGEFFRKAWELHPKYPEAPEHLIGIAMAGHTREGEDEEFWFMEAVKGQMDYKKAYTSYFWALRPRWGGSHKDILKLGIRAYNTKRFDTNAPRFLLKALLDISDESMAVDWRNHFRKPEIKKMIDEIYTKMLAQKNISKQKKDRLTLEYAFCKAWMGDYDKAKELYAKTPKDIPLDSLFYGDAGSLIRWRKIFEDELYAFTGKNKEVAKKWEEAILTGNVFDEFALEEALLDPEKSDLRTRQYFLDRITINTMDWSAKEIPDHTTVLSHVLYHKKENEAIAMIKEGADVNAVGPNKWTPLHYAVRYNSPKAVKLLLAKGAKVDAKERTGWTPLHHATRYATLDIVKMLLDKGGDLSARTDTNYSPFHLAVFNDDNGAEIVKFLLSKNVDINTRNKSRATPIHNAAQEGNTKIITMLLEKGANINALDPDDQTPLHYAAKHADAKTIKLLLDKGADINSLTKKHQHNALDLAIFYAKKHKNENIKILVENHIDLQKQDVAGDTPLHNAARKNDSYAIKLILEKGGDKFIENDNGKTAYDLARKPEVKKLLE